MWGLPMSDHQHRTPIHENHSAGNDIGFEREDLGGKPVYGFIISLAIFGVLLYFASWGIFHFLDAFNRKNQQVSRFPTREAEVNTRDVEASHILRFPQPRLEQNERTELD